MAIWDIFRRKKEEEKENEEIENPDEKIKRTTSLKTKEEYKKEVEKSKINQYQQTLTKEINYMGKYDPRIQEKYTELLKNKVSDTKLKKEMIDNSEMILKERCTMTIILEGEDPTNKGIIEIIGILPEYEQQIKEYFLEQTIHYKDWKKKIDGFKTYLNTQEKNIGNINSKLAIDEDLYVTKVKITCTMK